MAQPDLTIIEGGAFYTSVCTHLSDDLASRRLNEMLPTGISSEWAVSTDETFASGAPNPCPCEQDPDRHHVLFSC